MPDLDGIRVALLGGDERERILAQTLLRQGARVTLVGYLKSADLSGATYSNSVLSAVRHADVIIAPMSGTDEQGRIKAHLDPDAELYLNEAAFKVMPKGSALFIGMARSIIEALAARYDIRLIQVADVDEVAVLNSIATAEGAIQRAMEELPVTLHGTRVVVLGFGRCGATLARMLHGLGSRTVVVARDGGQLARAYEMGLETASFDQLAAVVSGARAVFNTVPARVLHKEVLQQMSQDAVIVDIASAPGGTDFDAAREMGIKAFLDLGIPGKVAPESAGMVLAKTLPQLIRRICLSQA